MMLEDLCNALASSLGIGTAQKFIISSIMLIGFRRKVLYHIVQRIGLKHGINQSKQASVRATKVHKQLTSSFEMKIVG
jgi:hypothetical protein